MQANGPRGKPVPAMTAFLFMGLPVLVFITPPLIHTWRENKDWDQRGIGGIR